MRRAGRRWAWRGEEHVLYEKKNLACVEVNPSETLLEAGFTSVVTNLGHFGTGNLELKDWLFIINA